MKIAMIGHKDFPSRSGGIEVMVHGLATRLAKRGHDVTVYNRGREKSAIFIRPRAWPYGGSSPLKKPR